MKGSETVERRLEALKASMLLQLRAERERDEIASLKAKMELNKGCLNEFRYGPQAKRLEESSTEEHWVLCGDYFSKMTARQAQSLVMQNQMQCAKHLETSSSKLADIQGEMDQTSQVINSLLLP